MSYITPAQLADSPGAQEIAQCATPANEATVATDLMDTVLRGGDTSSFDPAAVAIANKVLATVTSQITDASQLIDGFLDKRYSLPFDTAPPILTVWCRSIVRYKLNQNLVSDEKTNPIARDYRDALNLLQLVAAGKFSLGAGDPTGSTGAGGGPQVAAPCRTFDSGTLSDFVNPVRSP